jgi:hypothetical protein
VQPGAGGLQLVAKRATRMHAAATMRTIPTLSEIAMKALLSTVLAAAALSSAPAFADPASASTQPCPQIAAQLGDLLALPYKRIGVDGAVRLEFEVDASGRAQAAVIQGQREYRSAVRSALRRVSCNAGSPDRYVIDIHFNEQPTRTFASAARVVLAQATSR